MTGQVPRKGPTGKSTSAEATRYLCPTGAWVHPARPLGRTWSWTRRTLQIKVYRVLGEPDRHNKKLKQNFTMVINSNFNNNKKRLIIKGLYFFYVVLKVCKTTRKERYEGTQTVMETFLYKQYYTRIMSSMSVKTNTLVLFRRETFEVQSRTQNYELLPCRISDPLL